MVKVAVSRPPMLDIPVLVLETILIANIVLLLWLASRVWKIKKVRGTAIFTVILLLTTSISFFYLLEIASEDLEMKIFWLKMKDVPFAFLTPVVLLFTLNYHASRTRLPRWLFLLLSIEPVVFSFILWVEPVPGLIYTKDAVIIYGFIDGVGAHYGYLYNLHLAYIAILMVGSISHLGIRVFRTDKEGRGEFIILMIALLLPLIAAIVEVLLRLPGKNIDWPVFVISISSILVFIGLRAFNLFKIIPISYSKVLSNLDDGVVTIDKNMVVQDVNPAAVRLFDLQESDVIAHKFNRVFPRWAHMMRWEQGDDPVKNELFVDKGAGITLDLRSWRITEEDGGILGYLLIGKDITYEESYRTKLRKYNFLLTTVNKVLRHDLTNDLWVIEMLLEKTIETGDRSFVKRALKSTEKSMDTIERMRTLEMESLREEEKKVFELSSVLSRLMEHDDIEVSVKGNAKVSGDQGIYAVFNNLLSNAIKHGRAKKVSFKVKDDRDKVMVLVEDDGSGIPHSMKDEIFKEGVSFGETRGSGLGLFIVMMSMNRMGGSIRLDKEFKKGTRFILTFPSAAKA